MLGWIIALILLFPASYAAYFWYYFNGYHINNLPILDVTEED